MTLYDKVTTFAGRLVNSYAEFLVPAAMFVVFNSCVDQHTRDPEKLAILWLKFNQATEAVRASMFPLAQPNNAYAAASEGDDDGGELESDL